MLFRLLTCCLWSALKTKCSLAKISCQRWNAGMWNVMLYGMCNGCNCCNWSKVGINYDSGYKTTDTSSGRLYSAVHEQVKWYTRVTRETLSSRSREKLRARVCEHYSHSRVCTRYSRSRVRTPYSYSSTHATRVLAIARARVRTYTVHTHVRE